MSSSLIEKKARLLQLLDARAAAPKMPAVARRSDRNCGLSAAQSGLYFVTRLEGPNPAYNVPLIATLEGRLDLRALNDALNAVIARHDTLRTRFEERDGQVLATVDEFVAIDVRAEPCAPEAAYALALAEARKPFAMLESVLFRMRLLSESPTRHFLVVTMHHSISDAWSLGVFVRELAAFYAQALRGEDCSAEPLPVRYSDYVHWEAEWLASGVLRDQLEYWGRRLRDLPQRLELPADRPRSRQQDNLGATEHYRCDETLLAALKKVASQRRCSLFQVLFSGLAALLHRYSMQRDIAIAIGVSNRRRPELEGLIGFFVNTLLIRSEIPEGMSFSSLIDSVRENLADAQSRIDAPFHKVVESLRLDRGAAQEPLFQVMFTMQNVDFERHAELPELTIDYEVPDSGAAKFDLSFAIQELNSGLNGQIEYRAELFDPETVRRMCRHYVALLATVAANPDIPVAAIDFLSADEHAELRHLGRVAEIGAVTYPDLCTIFAEQVRAHPAREAVIADDCVISYRELDTRSDGWAARLRAFGLGEGARVALRMPRGVDAVVAMLAILKAGCAYVPFEPDLPRQRVRRMIEDSGAELLLTTPALAEDPVFADLRTLAMDALQAAPGPDAEDIPVVQDATEGRRLAYVMYTSGSTGEPKGVAVEHRGIVRLVRDADYVDLDAQTRTLLHSPLSFDASTFEIWAPLLNGGSVVIWAGEGADVSGMAACVRRHRVDTMWLSAGLLQPWVEQQRNHDLRLRFLLAGGDVVPVHCVREIYAIDPGVVFVNGYGPTENTTFSCCHRVPRDADIQASVPIGRPINGSCAYVLDDSLRLQARGCLGELWVGGHGLARGYIGREALTRERFVPDPFSAGSGDRLYRTGDLVRWQADGNLQFVGRRDAQVKIRGFRIELGEIEYHLGAFAEVNACVVMARDRPGGKQLVAYLAAPALAAGEEDSTLAAVRAAWIKQCRLKLAERLPDYMIPSAYVFLEALPVTENGKVDRRALPTPDDADFPRSEYVAPENPTQVGLCAIWQDVLGRERVGIGDHFFDSGGHSLLALQVISRVRRSFRVELPLAEVFEFPVLADLAVRIASMAQDACGEIVSVDRRRPMPLSPTQRRLWILAQANDASAAYHMGGATVIRGDLDIAALEAALKRIVARHEALRTRYVLVDGAPMQVVGDGEGFGLRIRDVRACADPEAAATAAGVDFVAEPFDLAHDLPLRVELLRLRDDESVLWVAMHHIASDGWSLALFFGEISALYAALRVGAPDPLPPLPLQYGDYSQWQHERLASGLRQSQATFWRRTLADAPFVLNLPTDRPYLSQQSYAGADLTVELDARTVIGLKALARRHGATLYMVLLAAWAALLGRLSNQETVVIGCPVAGRSRTEIESLIGFFVNTLPLRVDLDGAPSTTELLARVRGRMLEAQSHQDLPFDEIVDAVKPPRSLSRPPIFQVVFAWQNFAGEGQARGDLVLPGVETASQHVNNATAQFDLSLDLRETDDGVVGVLNYATALFDRETVERHMHYWRALLREMMENPESPVGSLAFIDSDERVETLQRCNETARDYPRLSCLHTLFETQAKSRPQQIAVECDGRALSYEEVDRRAGQWARRLRGFGVGPEARVALCLGRGVNAVTAILAVLKAGGAYVPIDPAYPPERISHMLADCAPTAVICDSRGRNALAAHLDGRPVLDTDTDAGVDAEAESSASKNLAGAIHGSEPVSVAEPQHLAYVIYTSGTTGTPKGVMIEHRAAVARISSLIEDYGLTPDDRCLQFASLHFDTSVTQIFATLGAGATLVMRGDEPWSPEDTIRKIAEHRLTIADVPTSYLEPMVADNAQREMPTLRILVIGGEAALSETLRGKILSHAFRNEYGPTETTITATCFEHPAGRAHRADTPYLPIGRPLANTRVYLLDAHRNPVPAGVAGEIYIGGHSVARGYLNRPELTAERFLRDPYAGGPDARMYRSGDLGRRLRDGNIEFLGRNDTQVKIRGFRIEPGEVEAALAACAGVGEAVVEVRADDSGQPSLVGYFSGDPGLGPWTLREHLSRVLPEYMLPAAYVRVGAWPIAPSGKIDRAALPPPDENAFVTRAEEAPEGPDEHALAAIWTEILGISRIGRNDRFFDIGGNSLKAVTLLARVRQAWPDATLTQLDFYRDPTISGLTRRIVAQSPATSGYLPQMGRSSQDKAHATLVCVPYAGGSAAIYAPLAEALCARIPRLCVRAVALPGREPGDSRKAFDSIESAAAAVTDELMGLAEGKIVLYGHSAGAALVQEMARCLQNAGRVASSVVLGAVLPIETDEIAESSDEPFAALDDDALYRAMSEWGADAGAIDIDTRTSILRAFRADALLALRYHRGPRRARIEAPLLNVIGSADPTTERYQACFTAWGNIAETASLVVIEGGDHYFVQRTPDELAAVLQKVIETEGHPST